MPGGFFVEVLKIRSDVDHPNSKGFLCPKGSAFGAARDDPDRVLAPLQRQPDGRVSWEVALDDIGLRLRDGPSKLPPDLTSI